MNLTKLEENIVTEHVIDLIDHGYLSPLARRSG
jgi:hypothetical protein